MSEHAHYGYFGKLPIKGDFVARGLPRSFIETWDAWLQDRLSASQQRLQDYWLETYLTCPLWRFALSPGMIDDNAWAGVIMPSVDSVNRHFPLTLAYPLPAATDLVHLATEHQHWFAQAEELLLSALDERLDLAAFDASIDELYSQSPANAAAPSQLPVHANGNALRIPLPASDHLPQALPGVMDALLRKRHEHYSLWWSDGSEHVEPSLVISPTLPSGDGFTAMLDGRWVEWGWEDVAPEVLG